ncbi:unnamed protein product [Cuscuta epithymum]|uniref:Uncharacterized protein n=1 Tax=Cuscuta epithymum TaxID=186058 RepID=A0AAV0FHL5_9ASTE|nr:unnamed protein product [Cuscuta epithymum]
MIGFSAPRPEYSADSLNIVQSLHLFIIRPTSTGTSAGILRPQSRDRCRPRLRRANMATLFSSYLRWGETWRKKQHLGRQPYAMMSKAHKSKKAHEGDNKTEKISDEKKTREPNPNKDDKLLCVKMHKRKK